MRLPLLRMDGRYQTMLLRLLLFLFVTGCQSGGETAVNPPLPPPANSTQEATAVPPSPTARPPQVAEAKANLSDAPPATLTPHPIATNTPPATATPTITLTPTPTLTPPPTFTPPALPFTSSNEHYWLRRPVAEGGVVWTNKIYPYGSTRGGTLRPHHGVEFDVAMGSEILAAASGTVVVAGSDSETVYGPHTDFYGNLVVIELETPFNGQPVYTLYGHLSELFVAVGEYVDAQQVIALSGKSGVADGPHMHFEVRMGANSYENTRNPMLWLYPYPDFGTVAGRIVWPGGTPVEEAPLTLRRIDANGRYLATTTYAGGSVNPDDQWQENFVIDDVPVGYYELVIKDGEKDVTTELWVHPYQTTFVEIELTP